MPGLVELISHKAEETSARKAEAALLSWAGGGAVRDRQSHRSPQSSAPFQPGDPMRIAALPSLIEKLPAKKSPAPTEG